MGSLTGARVVLEGAHAVSVGRERAHALAGVCQPALDRPVGAARVHVPVYQLRAGGGGRLAPDTAGQLRSPSKPLYVSGEGHVPVLVEKLDEPEMPLPGVPPARPLWCPRSCCPPPTSSAGQWGSGGLAGIRQTQLQSLSGPWPFAKSLTLLLAASPTVRTKPAPSSWGSDPTTQHSAP